MNSQEQGTSKTAIEKNHLEPETKEHDGTATRTRKRASSEDKDLPVDQEELSSFLVDFFRRVQQRQATERALERITANGGAPSHV